jgi:hypothetical protein
MLHQKGFAADSSLKVGICVPGSVPYVISAVGGTAEGFDLGAWNTCIFLEHS